MNFLAFFLCMAAVIFFGIEYGRTKCVGWVGMAALTLAWIAQIVWVTTSTVAVH